MKFLKDQAYIILKNKLDNKNKLLVSLKIKKLNWLDAYFNHDPS
jgi:hypothetical protein